MIPCDVTDLRFELERRSGAMITGAILTIATIERHVDGTIEVIESACAEFELPSREQGEVIALRRTVRAFCRRVGIRCLYLRGAAVSGSHAGGSIGFMIEAMLDATPGLEVRIVPAQRVSAWIGLEDRSIPEPINARLNKSIAGRRRMAVQTAVYVSAVGTFVALRAGSWRPQDSDHWTFRNRSRARKTRRPTEL